MMRLRIVLLVVSALAIVSVPAQASPLDPGDPGPFAVGHTSFLAVDPARDIASPFGGRPVFVSVWYPADALDITAETPGAAYLLDPYYRRWPVSYSWQWEQFGMPGAHEGVLPSRAKPFPLVVVSPGAGGRYYSIFAYCVRLASHGFVVAVTQHYHDGSYQWDTPDPFDTVMFNRPLDVSFMLDAVLARNDNSDSLLFNSIRPDLVAASGHSLGGYAALVLASGDDIVCGSTDDPLADTCVPAQTSLPDPRIKAVVPLDGSSQLLHFAELERTTVPSIGIGEPFGAQMQDFQARQHAAISAQPNYRVDVRNTVHNSFAMGCTVARVLNSMGLMTATQLKNNLLQPQCATALPQVEVHRLAATYAVAFLKTYLVGEPGYQEILTPGWALTREENIEFFVTEKRGGSVNEELPGFFTYFPHQPGSAHAQAQRDPVVPRGVSIIDPDM
jgi:predicted dienelactone hydrolase